MADGTDTLAGLRNGLRAIAEQKGEYAGIPMPLDGESLVIHPTYEFAAAMSEKFGLQRPSADDDHELSGAKVRNRFWSDRKRSDILIWEHNGRIDWGVDPGFYNLTQAIQTLGCADAWGIEQETKALELLGSLLKARAMRQYLLTGMFIETSKRSGVSYIFRRLRPTVAVRPGQDGRMRILCCLCMHPIAYYSGSWAGAMCPTDDVIAHLQLMRADEHMFWKRSNQHPSWRPEAGL